jgi:2-polyprenyl-3-methyl-5-hydroxy-6-metoxy-1,4-benzoquinol methylase
MLLFPKLESIQGVLKTGDYTISCSNGDTNSKVEKRISSLDGNVKFGVLEIDQDLEAQQEMKDRKFDVIVAFNITYGAQRPDVALSNVKKLLKPGGVACFIEVINPGPRLSMLGCSTSK